MAAAIGNKYAVGHGCGRPTKYSSASKMYSIGLNFIEETLAAEKHLTFTGLCIALGIVRETFNDYIGGKYDTDKEVFSVPLKDLKLRCENYAESRLFGNNPTGAIFALKNYGWRDTQNIELTGQNGGPLLVQDVSALSDGDLERLIEIADKLQIQGEIVDITPTED